MNNNETTNQTPKPSDATHHNNVVRILFMLAASALIIIIAVGILAYWMLNRPKAPKHKPVEQVTLVETIPVQKETQNVIVRAMGTVIPVEEVEIVAQVSGQLTNIRSDLVPGGYLSNGDVIAVVDQQSYKLSVAEAQAALEQAKLTCEERKLAIQQRASEVVQAEMDLIVQNAKRDIAQSEYDLMLKNKQDDEQIALAAANAPGIETTINTTATMQEEISENEKKLILREPYMKAYQAALDSARAAHETAEVSYKNAIAACEQAEINLQKSSLNLDWTHIKAPFNAVVLSKNVGTGSYVSSGNTIATLVNTERYWIEVSTPLNTLKWIEPEGSVAKIYYETAWGSEIYRTGTVKQITPDIETDGRMAKVIVEINDPRSLQPENRDKPALMLNSCVTVHIEGKPLEDIVRLPRATLRDGNSAWVLSTENTLEIHPVEIIARAPDYVFVRDGLKSGMRLITSDIPTPVAGMKLSEYDEEADQSNDSDEETPITTRNAEDA